MLARFAAVPLLLISLALLATLAISGCGGSESAKGDPDKLTIVARNGAKTTLIIEIADDEPERTKGLSGRQHLDEDAGMLFLLDDGRHAGFWMKDTLIPLSAAFISRCGEIVAIVEMKAQSLEIHNTPRDYLFGLEANAGWFKKHGLEVGDQVQIPNQLKQSGCD